MTTINARKTSFLFRQTNHKIPNEYTQIDFLVFSLLLFVVVLQAGNIVIDSNKLKRIALDISISCENLPTYIWKAYADNRKICCKIFAKMILCITKRTFCFWNGKTVKKIKGVMQCIAAVLKVTFYIEKSPQDKQNWEQLISERLLAYFTTLCRKAELRSKYYGGGCRNTYSIISEHVKFY